MLTASPSTSSPSTTTSPRLMPMRSTSRRAGDASACGSASSFWIATAQATASTTEPNSTSTPSPISLTMRPLCSATSGSITSARSALTAAIVAAFVRLDQPRIADHVGHHDGRQPPLDSARCSIPPMLVRFADAPRVACSADLDHHAPAHLAFDDLLRRGADVVEADRRRHGLQLVAVEVARRAAPRLPRAAASAASPN